MNFSEAFGSLLKITEGFRTFQKSSEDFCRLHWQSI